MFPKARLPFLYLFCFVLHILFKLPLIPMTFDFLLILICKLGYDSKFDITYTIIFVRIKLGFDGNCNKWNHAK